MHPRVDSLKSDPETQKRILGCQGLVRTIAWKIHRKVSRHADLDDLIGYGQVGLIEAARGFDSNRGYEFTTFAYHRIRGAILDGLSKMTWFRRADYMGGRYEVTASDSLRGAHDEGRGDLSALSHAATGLGVVHLFCQLSEGGFEVAEDADPGEVATTNELKELLVGLLRDLDNPERELIQAVYFDGLTLEEAGERAGHSKSWASRTHSRVIKTLARRLCSPEAEAVC